MKSSITSKGKEAGHGAGGSAAVADLVFHWTVGCLAETARPRKNSVRLIDRPSPRKSLVKGERFVRE